MADFRLPLWMLQKLTNDLANEPEKDFWEFVSYGGNINRIKRVKGLRADGSSFDSLDFTLNPDD